MSGSRVPSPRGVSRDAGRRVASSCSDALVAAGSVSPAANEVGDEDEQDGAGQSAANNNRHNVTA